MSKPILSDKHLNQSGRHARILRLAADPQSRPEQATIRPASVARSGRLTLDLPFPHATTLIRNN